MVGDSSHGRPLLFLRGTMKIHKILILACSLFSHFALPSTLHISPEMKLGPYMGAGISGGGLQLGIADTMGLDAIYFSHSHTSAEFLNYDKDRLKTYRLGAQYPLPMLASMAIQFEAGIVEYEGSRRSILSSDRTYRDGYGTSIATAWVVSVNDNIGVRSGIDVNYVDKSNTFLSNSLSATFSAGVTLQF